jgi:hypothetical protein
MNTGPPGWPEVTYGNRIIARSVPITTLFKYFIDKVIELYKCQNRMHSALIIGEGKDKKSCPIKNHLK